MKFIETKLRGVFVIEPEMINDERGFFARAWCSREFAEMGLNPALVQCNISYNMLKGTLRGMHYQTEPFQEVKLVRCTRGAVYDVAIDLRSDSPTICQWEAAELSAENRRMLYIPEGFAHGFETLQNDTEVFYQVTGYHSPENARGVRYDDPAFGIKWPIPVSTIVERDRSYPDFER